MLIPVAFLIGSEKGEQSKQNQPSVEFSQEEAITYVNEFMACLENKDYAKAYTYWNIEEGFGISLTKNGIGHISSNDLIKHPLSHLTL